MSLDATVCLMLCVCVMILDLIEFFRKQKNSNKSKQITKASLQKLLKSNKKKTSARLQAPKTSVSTSALLSLSDEEKKQVISWLDLERNAPILQKTDEAIAAKLGAKAAKTAALTLGGSGLNLPSSSRVKSAAQVLLDSDTDLTDEQIDAILGIDEGLGGDDTIVFEDPGVLLGAGKLSESVFLFCSSMDIMII